ncbi:DUF262 domain-containing protein [Feifania hominis]|uniref:DUF262 domain-containing protein n=1 Tax=Feifania hominis TaxID=2763660 RepID=A0A926DF14_9FIRM|nr:DUF262 domain-containing protein [Feifania hominis]MBC8535830.1 DUF262 domain-containing protein [Feifania hominis]
MKNFDSRTYSINDFVEWDERKQLEIAPKFQRRSVWSPQAKSYLIDTILRDKPLPKIFIRSITDPKTRTTLREIVDGQQRTRAILSFVHDGFRVSKVHNEEYGGLKYSELPEQVQAEFLKYEISVDLLLDLDDRDVLDIFARLNTYSIALNKQELINAKYFGYFKQFVYKLAGDYLTFWKENGIFTDRRIMRMAEVELVTDLVIAILDGIQSHKSAEKYYQLYDESFDARKQVEERFHATIDLIGNLFDNGLGDTAFRNVPIFYSMFLALYHMNYGIKGLDAPRCAITKREYPKVKNALEELDSILTSEEVQPEHYEFISSTRGATADVPARRTRSEFISRMIFENLES